jgi:CRP-like cAMP-binding protein
VGAFTLRKIKKRQFIGQPGVVANYRTYIVQGAFRAYIIDPAGRDHTINFAIDDWWVLDPTSYFAWVPAQLFIQALEDSTILELDYATQQRLMQTSRGIETLGSLKYNSLWRGRFTSARRPICGHILPRQEQVTV